MPCTNDCSEMKTAVNIAKNKIRKGKRRFNTDRQTAKLLNTYFVSCLILSFQIGQ